MSETIIEKNEKTTISANMISGTITIETEHKGSLEGAIADAILLLRDGCIRDQRSRCLAAALLGAASMIERAVAREHIDSVPILEQRSLV